MKTEFLEKVDIEAMRGPVVENFCSENNTDIWEEIAGEASTGFTDEIYKYAAENLLRVQIYIRFPLNLYKNNPI